MKKRKVCTVIAAAVMLAGCGKAGNDLSEAHIRSSSIPPVTVSSATTATAAASSEEETALSETAVSTTSTSAVSRAETSADPTSAAKQTALQTQAAVTTTAAETVASTETSPTEPAAESEETPEAEAVCDTFYGVLIDEDCSDFEDPPLHDTQCMFMTECRASGYGLDIKQEDGSWVFYMFDENGQALAWDYLNSTGRLDGLFVTVSGTWEDNLIKVVSIEESEK